MILLNTELEKQHYIRLITISLTIKWLFCYIFTNKKLRWFKNRWINRKILFHQILVYTIDGWINNLIIFLKFHQYYIIERELFVKWVNFKNIKHNIKYILFQ